MFSTFTKSNSDMELISMNFVTKFRDMTLKTRMFGRGLYAFILGTFLHIITTKEHIIMDEKDGFKQQKSPFVVDSKFGTIEKFKHRELHHDILIVTYSLTTRSQYLMKLDLEDINNEYVLVGKIPKSSDLEIISDDIVILSKETSLIVFSVKERKIKSSIMINIGRHNTSIFHVLPEILIYGTLNTSNHITKNSSHVLMSYIIHACNKKIYFYHYEISVTCDVNSESSNFVMKLAKQQDVYANVSYLNYCPVGEYVIAQLDEGKLVSRVLLIDMNTMNIVKKIKNPIYNGFDVGRIVDINCKNLFVFEHNESYVVYDVYKNKIIKSIVKAYFDVIRFVRICK